MTCNQGVNRHSINFPNFAQNICFCEALNSKEALTLYAEDSVYYNTSAHNS